jgi:hypothetical protein
MSAQYERGAIDTHNTSNERTQAANRGSFEPTMENLKDIERTRRRTERQWWIEAQQSKNKLRLQKGLAKVPSSQSAKAATIGISHLLKEAEILRFEIQQRKRTDLPLTLWSDCENAFRRNHLSSSSLEFDSNYRLTKRVTLFGPTR